MVITCVMHSVPNFLDLLDAIGLYLDDRIFEISYAVYVDPQNRTLDEIASLFGKSESTLRRLRKEIINFAKKLGERHNYFYKFLDLKAVS